MNESRGVCRSRCVEPEAKFDRRMSERGDGNRYAHAGGCILRPYLKIRCTAGRNARTTMSRRITGRVRTHKRFPSLDDMMRLAHRGKIFRKGPTIAGKSGPQTAFDPTE
eukprot:1182705-Prorocentrum_minimum.AAC.1